MSRTPHAMKTLIRQVTEHREDAALTTDDKDGFGVDRTVVFDEETSKWLSPLIAIFRDNRIAGIAEDETGSLRVTFVGDNRADNAHAFLLPEVDKIMSEQVMEPVEVEPEAEVAEDAPPSEPKKRPAKKSSGEPQK